MYKDMRHPNVGMNGGMSVSQYETLSDPNLRVIDSPRLVRASKIQMIQPDRYMGEVVSRGTAWLQMRAMNADPFRKNMPPAGQIEPYHPNGLRIPILAMDTREILSIMRQTLKRNMIFIGPTGSGKTTALRKVIRALYGDAIVICFERKGDLIGGEKLVEMSEQLVVLEEDDLVLAMLQPWDPSRIRAFINQMVNLIASHFNLFASKRLLADELEFLFKQRREPGTWPTLSELVRLVYKLSADPRSRIGGYREALLEVLKYLLNTTGTILDHQSSTMIEKMLSRPRTFIIRLTGLPTDSASFIASRIIFETYESRGDGRHVGKPDVYFILDDAMPLIQGNDHDSEGGINPISTWAFMGRGRGLGMICSAQNYSLCSVAFRNNCDSIMCFGAYGRDAMELARDMNLDEEQRGFLSTIRPGHAVAFIRSEWPLAVYGEVSEE
jgi:hypothetical protein